VAGKTNRTNRYVGSASALLLSLSCSFTYASNLVKSDCDEMNDPPAADASSAPPLAIKMTDHGLTDSASDMRDPASDPAAEKVSSPILADDAEETVTESVTETDASVAVDELPETALRLPGVSDQELPRFRRQMYRTDI
jgi:hypothetical protein